VASASAERAFAPASVASSRDLNRCCRYRSRPRSALPLHWPPAHCRPDGSGIAIFMTVPVGRGGSPRLLRLLPLPPLSSSCFRLRLISPAPLARLAPARCVPAPHAPGGPDAPIAGFRIRIDSRLSSSTRLGLRHLPLQRRLRRNDQSCIRPYPHPVLGQLLQINQPHLAQGRQCSTSKRSSRSAQQTRKSTACDSSKTRRRRASGRRRGCRRAVQRPRAADAIARGVQPKRSSNRGDGAG